MGAETWASRLADHMWAQLAERPTPPIVHRLTPVSEGVLEVVFYGYADTTLRGLRLDKEVFDAETGRLEGSSLEELAFDVIHMGIREPRDPESFLPEDDGGVRWMPLSDWIADVS